MIASMKLLAFFTGDYFAERPTSIGQCAAYFQAGFRFEQWTEREPALSSVAMFSGEVFQDIPPHLPCFQA